MSTPDDRHPESDDQDHDRYGYDDDDEFDDGSNHRYVPEFSPAPGHPRTVSQDTINQYSKMVKIMRRRYRRDFPSERQEDINPSELVDHLISRSHMLRPKTFINYRCALLYMINTSPQSSDTGIARLKLQTGVPRNGYKGTRGPRSKKGDLYPATLYSTKSSRPRNFERKQFEKLIAELNYRSGPTSDHRVTARASDLIIWLKAGLASGLRPVEWETARWSNKEKGELFVHTAKTKQGTYALPNLASLPLPEAKTRIVKILPDEILWVDQQMSRVKNHLLKGEPFKNYYNNNRIYLWDTCRDLFGNSRPPFTLYLMRGQFAANRKRSGMPVDEVSAQMGCSPRIVSTAYGKLIYGHSTSMPDKPSTEQKAKPAPANAGPRPFKFSTGGRNGNQR